MPRPRRWKPRKHTCVYPQLGVPLWSLDNLAVHLAQDDLHSLWVGCLGSRTSVGFPDKYVRRVLETLVEGVEFAKNLLGVGTSVAVFVIFDNEHVVYDEVEEIMDDVAAVGVSVKPCVDKLIPSHKAVSHDRHNANNKRTEKWEGVEEGCKPG